MNIRTKMIKYLRFSTGSKFRIGVALFLMFSAGSEVFNDFKELLSESEFSLGSHHGVFGLGLAYLLKALADLGEDIGIATEGLILAEEEGLKSNAASNAGEKQHRSSQS